MVSSNLLQHKVLIKVCRHIGLILLLFYVWITPSIAAQMLGDGVSFGKNDHPHNLSNLNTGGVGTIKSVEIDQICIFCHTPHNASADGPLWNRERPVKSGSFSLYGRLGDIAIDDDPAGSGSRYGLDDYPNGASRLCLSCHDGVTAMGTVVSGGNIAPSLGTMAEEGSTIGTIILSESHPISFVYTEPVRAFIVSNQSVADATYTLPDPVYLDSDSRMQCTTCHDPHSDTRTAAYDLPMWRDNLTADPNADYETTCNVCHQGGLGGSGSPGLDLSLPFGGTGTHNILP